MRTYFDRVCDNLKVDGLCKLEKENRDLKERAQKSEAELAEYNNIKEAANDLGRRALKAEAAIAAARPLLEALRKCKPEDIEWEAEGTDWLEKGGRAVQRFMKAALALKEGK